MCICYSDCPFTILLLELLMQRYNFLHIHQCLCAKKFTFIGVLFDIALLYCTNAS